MESRRRVSWNTESAAASNGEWEGETSSRRPRCSAPRRQEQACWPVARRKAHPKHRLRPRLRQPGASTRPTSTGSTRLMSSSSARAAAARARPSRRQRPAPTSSCSRRTRRCTAATRHYAVDTCWQRVGPLRKRSPATRAIRAKRSRTRCCAGRKVWETRI